MPMLSETKHDHATCPCCGEVFVCMMNRPLECPCNEVKLSNDETIDLSFEWFGQCLCPDCLTAERDKLRVIA